MLPSDSLLAAVAGATEKANNAKVITMEDYFVFHPISGYKPATARLPDVAPPVGNMLRLVTGRRMLISRSFGDA
jgi:hypothetical protein